MKVENESVPPIIVGYTLQLLDDFTHPSTRANCYAMLQNVNSYLNRVLAEYQAKEAKGEFNNKPNKKRD